MRPAQREIDRSAAGAASAGSFASWRARVPGRVATARVDAWRTAEAAATPTRLIDAVLQAAWLTRAAMLRGVASWRPGSRYAAPAGGSAGSPYARTGMCRWKKSTTFPSVSAVVRSPWSTISNSMLPPALR